MLKLVQVLQFNTFPTEWDGLLEDGRRMYIRFRSGAFKATAGQSFDDAVSFGNGRFHAVMEYSDDVEAGLQEELEGAAREAEFQRRIAVFNKDYPGGETVVPRSYPKGDEDTFEMETSRMLELLEQAGVVIDLKPELGEVFKAAALDNFLRDTKEEIPPHMEKVRPIMDEWMQDQLDSRS